MAAKYSIFCLFMFVLLQCTKQRPLDAKQHLYTYGFLNSTDPNPKTLEEGIKKFQTINGLTVTGQLTNETLNKMESRRCGMTANTPVFLATRYKWRQSSITYKIQNWTQPFTKEIIRNIFEEAIMQWTDNVNLRITETTSDTADILIYFTNQDGPYNVLGYAYFPENGDIYFDEDENWTLDLSRAKKETYFGWVATHELGHSLGLSHSENMQSIMFPYYTYDVTQPTDFDLSRLRSIYGKAAVNNTMLCSGTTVDAILDTKEPMIIKGRQYWTLSNESLQSGPFFLDLLYPGVPDQIDAAFMVGTSTYMLSNDVFHKYKPKSKTYTKKLISKGFEDVPPNLNAAFYDSASRMIYFFKGSKYYMFDTTKSIGKRLIITGKNISRDWNGVPSDIEAATILKNSRVLFIKNSKCYVVDLSTKQLLVNQDCKTTFFNC